MRIIGEFEMKWKLIAALLVLGALLAGDAVHAQGGNDARRKAMKERREGKLKAGDPAADFTLQSPDGKKVFKLSSFKGKKPVVLVFGSYT